MRAFIQPTIHSHTHTHIYTYIHSFYAYTWFYSRFTACIFMKCTLSEMANKAVQSYIHPSIHQSIHYRFLAAILLRRNTSELWDVWTAFSLCICGFAYSIVLNRTAIWSPPNFFCTANNPAMHKCVIEKYCLVHVCIEPWTPHTMTPCATDSHHLTD